MLPKMNKPFKTNHLQKFSIIVDGPLSTFYIHPINIPIFFNLHLTKINEDRCIS